MRLNTQFLVFPLRTVPVTAPSSPLGIQMMQHTNRIMATPISSNLLEQLNNYRLIAFIIHLAHPIHDDK